MDGSLQAVLVVALFGLIFGGAGVWLLLGQKRLEKVCTAYVKGTVEGIQRDVSTSRGADGQRSRSVTYTPTFKYVVNGTEYIKTPNTSSSRVSLTSGDTVSVYYDPDNPDTYYVPEYGASRTLGIILVIVGVAIIALGIYLGIAGEI